MRAVIAAYLDHLSARVSSDDYTSQAFDDARRDLTRFGDHHGDKHVGECRRYDLTQWLIANPQWKSNHTKKRVIATLLSCFNWAEDEELIERSPYRRPRNMRLPTVPRREATPEEYVALMRGGSRPLRRGLFFLRRTGARTCEMRELLWPEIDFDAAVVRKTKHKTRRTSGKPRLFGLEPCVLRFLRNLYQARDQSDEHVFLNCHGTPWDRHSFARHLRRCAKRIGLDEGVVDRVTGYCIRHSYAGWAVEEGVGERQIADQMGHADTRMIAWYSKAKEKARHLRNVAAQAVKRKRK